VTLGILGFSVLSLVGYQIGFVELLLFLLLISGIYFGLPRAYFLLKVHRGEFDDIVRRLESKRVEGAFDLLS